MIAVLTVANRANRADEVGFAEHGAHLGPVEDVHVLLVAADRDVPARCSSVGLFRNVA